MKTKDIFEWFFISIVCLVIGYILIPSDLAAFADIFNKLSLGIAALLGAFFGSSYVRDLMERRENIKYYLKKYPHSEYGKKWEIIESVKNPGPIYLFDIKKSQKYHIVNMTTVYDLGWHIYPRKSISDNLFLSYSVGDRISTFGNVRE